jgi:hypothetical protein
MIDLKLNTSHDLLIENYDLVLTENDTAQKIKQKLSLFSSEWFLDESLGVTYHNDVFKKDSSTESIRSLLIRELNKIEEVVEVQEVELDLNEESRLLDIKIMILDKFSQTLEVSL